MIHHNVYTLASLKLSVICDITEKLYANVQNFFVVVQNSNGKHKNAYIGDVTVPLKKFCLICVNGRS